jgi:transcriptional regulator with XRE-family HTH domain
LAGVLGNQIRERRRAARLTQQQLADLAHASRSTVKLLEGGYSPPLSPTRDRILALLDELEAERREAGDHPALIRAGNAPQPQATRERDRVSIPVADAEAAGG